MKFEFAHDTLARSVYHKASAEVKARRQVRSMVEREFLRYQSKGILLQQDDLDEIRPFENQINFSEEEIRFIRKSRRAIRQKRRRNLFIALGVIVLLFIALVISLIATSRANIAQQKAEKSAKENAYQSKVFESKLAFQVDGDATKSLQLALDALEVDTATYKKSNIDFLSNFRNALFQGDAPTKSYLHKAYGLIPSSIRSIAFAKNRNHLTALLHNKQIAIFDPETLVPSFVRSGENLLDLHFTPDKNFILGLTANKEIFIWDVAGQLENKVKLNKAPENLSRIQQSPDGNYFLGVSRDNNISLWTRTGEPLPTHPDLNKGLRSAPQIAFSSDNKHLILLKETMGSLMDIFTGGTNNIKTAQIIPIEASTPNSLKLPEENIVSAQLSPRNNAYLIVNENGEVVSRNLRSVNNSFLVSGTQRALYNRNVKNIAANYSPKGNYVVTISNNQRVSIWRSAKNSTGVIQIGDALNTEGKAVEKIIWKADESAFIIHTKSKLAKVYQINNTDSSVTLSGQIVGHSEDIKEIIFSPNGKRIASFQANEISAVLEWLPHDDESIHPLWLEQNLNLFQSLPQSDYIICQKTNNPPKVYSQKNRQLIGQLDNPDKVSFDLVANSPDGKHIFLTSKGSKKIDHWKKDNQTYSRKEPIEVSVDIFQIHCYQNNLYIYSNNQYKLLEYFSNNPDLEEFSIESFFTGALSGNPDDNTFALLSDMPQENIQKLFFSNVEKPSRLKEIPVEFPLFPTDISFEGNNFISLMFGDFYITPLNEGEQAITKTKTLQVGLNAMFAASEEGIVGIAPDGVVAYLTPSDTTNIDSFSIAYNFIPFPDQITNSSLFKDELVLVSDKGEIKAFHLNVEQNSINIKYPEESLIKTISFSQDYSYLYTLDANGRAQTWILSTSGQIEKLSNLGILGSNKELKDYMEHTIKAELE